MRIRNFVALCTFVTIVQVQLLIGQEQLPEVALNDLTFVDEQKGWVVGEKGTLWMTDNGGISWEPQNSGVTDDLFRVQYLNASIGWALGTPTTLLSTVNGGAHWQARSLATEGSFSDLFFATASIGWVVASDSIFKTEDGGATWKGIVNPGIVRLKFWDATIGWGYNRQSTIYRTTDGGATWNVKRTNDFPLGWLRHNEYYQAVTLSSGGVVLAGQGADHYDAWALTTETTDGGETWKEKRYMWFRLNDLAVLEDAVVAFGSPLLTISLNGKIVNSRNGVIVRSGVIREEGYPPFKRVVFLNSNDGLAISDSSFFGPGNYYLSHSKFYKTTDGGVTWERLYYSVTDVEQNSASLVPSTFTLYQNYPNPFNPETTIDFDVARDSDVRLVIYDVLGQEITTLVHQRLKAGQHRVKFNAVSLPSGTYFYRLYAGGTAQTKKLMLLK